VGRLHSSTEKPCPRMDLVRVIRMARSVTRGASQVRHLHRQRVALFHVIELAMSCATVESWMRPAMSDRRSARAIWIPC